MAHKVVSIHTPTKGVTAGFSRQIRLPIVSIHTPTKGVTPLALNADLMLISFNPHTHEGCDRCRLRRPLCAQRTGAPVEQMPFEEVNYWEEVTEIFDWARTHVTSTLYICWAAQAGLYHFYGVPKYDLPAKMFGVFRHTLREPYVPIFRGFDDEFYVPHSRHTEIRREDVMKVPDLTLLSESEESGVYMAMARGGREFFITGHSEYSPYTLNDEYMRDVNKGLPIAVPRNYYRNNNPALGPVVRWRGHANLLFTNWLNYYVYQETPFRIEDISKLGDL